MLKRWTKIEDCPHNKQFIAILKHGWKIKIRWVYVHVDNHFLMWRELRTLGACIGQWRCILFLES